MSIRVEEESLGKSGQRAMEDPHGGSRSAGAENVSEDRRRPFGRLTYSFVGGRRRARRSASSSHCRRSPRSLFAMLSRSTLLRHSFRVVGPLSEPRWGWNPMQHRKIRLGIHKTRSMHCSFLPHERATHSLLPQPTHRPFSTATRPGAGLGQRLSSFVIGAGVTALATQFYLWDELRQGNAVLIKRQAAIEERLAKLEQKK